MIEKFPLVAVGALDLLLSKIALLRNLRNPLHLRILVHSLEIILRTDLVNNPPPLTLMVREDRLFVAVYLYWPQSENIACDPNSLLMVTSFCLLSIWKT